MRSHLHRPVALAFALSIPCAANAQTAPAVLPSFSVTSEQIYLANTTDQEIVLYVESENTQRTEYHLLPGTARTLSGEPGDRWLNIEMQAGASSAGAATAAAGSGPGTRP
ncbi:hypothetical protein CAL12_13175 [Bordetella genomosp. 8]|uniref:Uncharacterized protein n=1 Tax=Bordetella genomosp. 8 TaxID=1416806 RepID=A0A1W6YL18_9BORD|nr:hypothetical protein [Bordetella genomosp. 8]ARP81669.1 hypothetical protein CAL12_13175 [Bordetella genomosp. 8]